MSTSEQGTTRSGGISSRVLLAIGLIAAVVYIISMWINLPAVELIAKGIPVLCLVVWLWTLPRDRFANLIMGGLVVCVLGALFGIFQAAVVQHELLQNGCSEASFAIA